MKLASSRLIVRDLKQTLAFYIDSLGFTLVAAFPDRDAPTWATVVHEESDIDRFTLMFLDQNAIDPESYVYRPDFEKMERGAGINFYFDIVGVDPLYLRLKRRGAPRDSFTT